MSARPVVVLSGGVGAARFLRGLVRVVPPEEIVVIGNTGDDMWWHGLYIAPDLDTVTYWLAGVADESRGWGIRGDTFTAQAAFAQLTDRSWFQLGDRDLATHLYRTGRLAAGVPLHRVTAGRGGQPGAGGCRSARVGSPGVDRTEQSEHQHRADPAGARDAGAGRRRPR